MGELTGHCNCGGVRFTITAPLLDASYCHCTRCQRRTGTAASANGRLEPGSLRIDAGEELLRAWSPPDGWEKVFCGRCGSSLFSRDPRHPERGGVRLGVLVGDPGVRPSRRQFTAYAAPWEPIPDDGLPRFPERLT
ncbi:MAG TPA: GFA family protein [Solirubrobacteraceae bacterium]|jgi:hypothetical protein|nr:GFA family protein [Solirubrobacteraceae bacterium]